MQALKKQPLEQTTPAKYVMHGILNTDKPAGITSARAVARVKRLLPKGTKIGHAGTLDPFATGVLLLLVGRATKLCEALMDQPKQYEATVFLGATTNTDDPESPRIVWSTSSPTPTLEDVTSTLAGFKGQNNQIPPIFSAMKVNGRRAYDLARKGTPPVMVPRLVHIYDIQMIDYSFPELKLRVDCGRGTYIRSLARDIGAALNVGGHLTQLRRTKIGQFNITNANLLVDLTPDSVQTALVPIDQIQTTPR